MTQTIVFDSDLIGRYNLAGPRYTSYPTAVEFDDGFGEDNFRRLAEQSNRNGEAPPISLYFHLPFCDTVCYYCACSKVVTRDHGRAAPYLKDLGRELALKGALFDRARPVKQLHWGGGTPTFLSHGEMRALMAETARHFTLLDGDEGEYSIEIDPRGVDAATIALLREIGFNRLSLGVQDFEPRVQKAVNRIQGEDETRAVIDAARAEGFRSVSIDLIYGLPHQDGASFERTLARIIDIDPDRLSVFNYAHLPHLFKPQRRIDEADLPSPAEKLEILQLIIQKLVAAGYVFIGMDHFAKPEDELALAQSQGTLHRNFQGYSTHGDCDLVGLGITAISKVGDGYAQNLRTLDDYAVALDEGRIPVHRGIELDFEDRVRRAVITELICHFRLDFATLEHAHGIDFRDFFGREMSRIEAMARDGLVDLTPDGITVRPAGRLLVRNICMTFDRYHRPAAAEPRFSKVI